jgi:hexosaminidase
LIAIYQTLQQLKMKELTDELFWMDPWSTEGQAVATELRPLLPGLRLHAERAITLLAQARATAGLEETDAVDALELGGRRLDFIGQKFETADTIAALYKQAYGWQQDPQNAKRKTQNVLAACCTAFPARMDCVKTCAIDTVTLVLNILTSG